MTSRTRRLVVLAASAAAVALPTRVLAHDCSSLSDCFGVVQTALAAIVAVGGIALSLGLDLIPGIGTAKGIYEAFTGRDAVTGAELAWWERALGIVPLGGALVGGAVALRRMGGLADLVGDATRRTRGAFNTGSDPLRRVLGPAKNSHPEEYRKIMGNLADEGVEVQLRSGSMAYSPSRGRPGRLIFDEDGSIGALRHEYRHYRDIKADGFPDLAHYYRNPDEFWRLEFRGWMEEVRLARQHREFEVGKELVKMMRNRRRELLGH